MSRALDSHESQIVLCQEAIRYVKRIRYKERGDLERYVKSPVLCKEN